MRRRRAAGLLVAIIAMVWIGAIVTASTLLVVETIGAVEREVAKLRADAATDSALALLAASPPSEDLTLSLDRAAADLHIITQDGPRRARIVSTGWARNDLTLTRKTTIDLPR